jgi:hypothetical protein
VWLRQGCDQGLDGRRLELNVAGEQLERIGLGSTQRQPGFAVVGVEGKELAGDVLSHGDNLRRVLTPLPGQLGNGDEADTGEDGMVRSVVQIDEDAEALVPDSCSLARYAPRD